MPGHLSQQLAPNEDGQARDSAAQLAAGVDRSCCELGARMETHLCNYLLDEEVKRLSVEQIQWESL